MMEDDQAGDLSNFHQFLVLLQYFVPEHPGCLEDVWL